LTGRIENEVHVCAKGRFCDVTGDKSNFFNTVGRNPVKQIPDLSSEAAPV
jgi:hypothetical protein